MIYLKKQIEKIKKVEEEEGKIRLCITDWFWDWIITDEEYKTLGEPKIGDTFIIRVVTKPRGEK